MYRKLGVERKIYGNRTVVFAKDNGDLLLKEGNKSRAIEKNPN